MCGKVERKEACWIEQMYFADAKLEKDTVATPKIIHKIKKSVIKNLCIYYSNLKKLNSIKQTKKSCGGYIVNYEEQQQ